MIEEQTIIQFLGILNIILAGALLIVSAATCGRHKSDLEYQKLVGDTGTIRNIEAQTGIRTHANRIILAIVVTILALLLIAEVVVVYRLMFSWSLVTITMISFTVSSVMDWIAEYRKMKIYLRSSKDGKPPIVASRIEDDIAPTLP
jgi:hypothetical protein